MAVDLRAVAGREFPPRVKKNVHVNLSFRGDFFFFFLFGRANVQKLLVQRERDREKLSVGG